MEFELFFDTDLSYHAFAKIIVETFKETAEIIDIEEDEDGCYLSHRYFSITIFIDTYGLDMLEEDYDIKVTSSMNINLFSKTSEIGMSLLLKIIGVLLKKIKGNSILLGESSTVIFKKINNQIFAYNNPEQYFFKISFEDLGVAYDSLVVK